jgi:hypothetical protein
MSVSYIMCLIVLVEKPGVPGKKSQPSTNTSLSHKLLSITSRHGIETKNLFSFGGCKLKYHIIAYTIE